MKYFGVISAMFLVGGTCIGGGMLALPIATGISGLLPSFVIMTICWLAMTATALLLLEATLWMEEGVHVITITSRILGAPGRIVAWILYLFICYASIVAYTAGGGVQIASVLNHYFDITISKHVGSVLFILVFGLIIYIGAKTVGWVNTVVFVAMIVAYILLVGMGIDEINPQLLTNRRWETTLLGLPLLLTAFSFQTMVPSLTPYLKKHAKYLRIAIIGGTFIAFLVYAIWQTLILGIVPLEGPNGLAEALAKGEPATQFLKEHVDGYWVALVAEYFAFFAIITSFFGIALGLYDFLSDGLHIKKEGMGKVILGLLIVLPTILFATQFERIFLLALDTSGGYGDTILNGIIPVLIVWVGRYRMGYKDHIQLPGGRIMLTVVFTFFTLALILEILAHLGYVASIYDAYKLIDINMPEIKEG